MSNRLECGAGRDARTQVGVPTDSVNLPSIKVLTLNVLFDPYTIYERLPAIAHEIVASGADIVMLQEVPPLGEGTHGGDWLAAETGLSLVAHAHHPEMDTPHGVAILSRLPQVAASTSLNFPHDGKTARRAVAVQLRAPSGRTITAMTAHLAWGGHREALRVHEAVLLDDWATSLATPEGYTILCGDFNAIPESDTLRFLTGLSSVNGRGAYWVDAWEKWGDGPGWTNGPQNPWAAATAIGTGLTAPELLPHRRIDYTLTHGWAHGRPGCPLSARLAGLLPCGPTNVIPSDHYGVVSDHWDPPLPRT